MNPFLLGTAERLAHWKAFRCRLIEQPAEAQLNAVASYWAQAPLGPRAFDPMDASRWASAWDWIEHNRWCRSSVAIGMANTLRLIGMPNLTLQLISDDMLDTLLVLVADDAILLNYDWGLVRVLPVPNAVLCQWRYCGRKYVTC